MELGIRRSVCWEQTNAKRLLRDPRSAAMNICSAAMNPWRGRFKRLL
jgi:hypothetical protein